MGLAAGLNFSEKYYNLSQHERDMIIREVKYTREILLDEIYGI